MLTAIAHAVKLIQDVQIRYYSGCVDTAAALEEEGSWVRRSLRLPVRV
jgi:hypothetical protein